MERLDFLRNRHRGERCVLLGNGPSLNKIDLRFLRKETVIGVNKLYLGLKRFGFWPRYYVVMNPTVIQQGAAEIQALRCVKFLDDRAAAGLIPEDPITYLLNSGDPAGRFCKDINEGVHSGWTVIYAALQIAFFLGFTKVCLLGIDHTYEFRGAPNEPSVLHGPDPNHFDERYFGYGQKWDNPDLLQAEESYEIAKAVYEEAGREIIDATLGGKCTIFPKADYRELFGLS